MFVKPLTPKQKKIVDFILKYYVKHGYSPSLEEIAGEFGKALSTIHKHVELIQKKGTCRKKCLSQEVFHQLKSRVL